MLATVRDPLKISLVPWDSQIMVVTLSPHSSALAGKFQTHLQVVTPPSKMQPGIGNTCQVLSLMIKSLMGEVLLKSNLVFRSSTF